MLRDCWYCGELTNDPTPGDAICAYCRRVQGLPSIKQAAKLRTLSTVQEQHAYLKTQPGKWEHL